MSSYLCNMKINYFFYILIRDILVRQELIKKSNNSVSTMGLDFCTVPPPECEESNISIFLFNPFGYYITK